VTTWLFWGLAILKGLTRIWTNDLPRFWSWLESNTLTTLQPKSTNEVRVKVLVNRVFLVRHVTKWLFWSVAILWNPKRNRTHDLSLWISWLKSNTLTTQQSSSTDELGVKSLVNRIFPVNTLDTWQSDCSKPWQVWGVWAEIEPMTSDSGPTRDQIHDLFNCVFPDNRLDTWPRDCPEAWHF